MFDKISVKRITLIIGLIAFVTHAYSAEKYANKNSIAFDNWTGFYTGLNLGGVTNQADLSAHQMGLTNPNGQCHNNSDSSSFFGGLQLGYNYQTLSQIVVGLEGEFNAN